MEHNYFSPRIYLVNIIFYAVKYIFPSAYIYIYYIHTCKYIIDFTCFQSACSVSYTAGTSVGYYVAAIQVEDFATASSTTALSSIPLQFIVKIYSGSGCSDASQFVSPTPAANTKHVIDMGSPYTFTIQVYGPHS